MGFITGVGIAKGAHPNVEHYLEDAILPWSAPIRRNVKNGGRSVTSLLDCQKIDEEDLWPMIHRTRAKMDKETQRLDGLIQDVSKIFQQTKFDSRRRLNKATSTPAIQLSRQCLAAPKMDLRSTVLRSDTSLAVFRPLKSPCSNHVSMARTLRNNVPWARASDRRLVFFELNSSTIFPLLFLQNSIFGALTALFWRF